MERKIERKFKGFAKEKKGITLIALIITIVILIILATITLNFAFGEGGLIESAQQAKNLTEQAVLDEQERLNSLMREYTNITAGGNEQAEPILETESYVGYYADVDGDKLPDGVIYIDLADTENTSGTWNSGSWSNYEYTPVTEELKQYEICSESYTGFGSQWTMPVLTTVEGSTGADRFYVMALEDFNDANGPYYCWYDAAYGNLDNTIGTGDNDFGQGRANTIAMIAKWNGEGYGVQDDNGTYKDMWGVIQTAVGNINDPKWFVPSKAEWAAFGDFAYTKMGVDTGNYGDYELYSWYWSSTQNDTNYAYVARFNNGYVGSDRVNLSGCMRLSATF